MSKPAKPDRRMKASKAGGIIATRRVALRAGPAQRRLAEMLAVYEPAGEPERYRWDVGLTKANMKNCRWLRP